MTDRTSDPRVLSILTERWSPRSFDRSEIVDADLKVLFEAAGWAPSAYNVQPWTFLYAKRDTADWDRFLNLLVPFNQSWAKDASVLVFIVSDTMMGEGEKAQPSHSHSFDAGAAWAQLALQAVELGYHAHGMTGVDFDAARRELAVPDRFRVEAAVAIGRKAPVENLPEELQSREEPSGRKPVETIMAAGNFPG